MASKRGRPPTSTKHLEPHSPTASSGTTPPAPPGDDVEDLLTAASDDRDAVWLSRRGSASFVHLKAFRPLELREQGVRETVRQLYGGGHFRARLRARSGQWGASRDFAIEGEAKTPPPEPSSSSSSTAAAPATSASGPPDWVRQVVVPVLTAVGVGVAGLISKRLLDGPQADPALAALARSLEKMGRGEPMNPLELQRLLLDAEQRGEERGRELGELGARVESRGEARESGGVVGAIDRAVPLINRMLDAGERKRRGSRMMDAPRELPATASIDQPSASAPTVPDIAPAWLRPFMGYRSVLLGVADRGKNAEAYAGMLMDAVEDDEQLLTAIVQADREGRLLSDLRAAIPEIAATPERATFAESLVSIVREMLQEMTVDETAPPEPARSSEAANG